MYFSTNEAEFVNFAKFETKLFHLSGHNYIKRDTGSRIWNLENKGIKRDLGVPLPG